MTVLLAQVNVTCSSEQKAALIARAIKHDDLVRCLQRVCQDAASREIARLTTAGPESSQGWQQRCNACRRARAEECAECATDGQWQAGAVAGDGA